MFGCSTLTYAVISKFKILVGVGTITVVVAVCEPAKIEMSSSGKSELRLNLP